MKRPNLGRAIFEYWRRRPWLHLFWIAPLVIGIAVVACQEQRTLPRTSAAPALRESIRVATPAPTALPLPTATADLRPPLERTRNILILGSDQRPNEPNWRTDVIMIVAVDIERQRVGVISLPRDLFLEEIPGHQANRINVVDYLGEQAEVSGGPKLLAQIIQARMGIRIDNFVRFNFDAFQNVINAIGGVEVDVDCSYADAMSGLYIKPGHYLMDGELALKYVRSRYTTSDLDRARRQQQVIWAVRQAMASKDQLTRIPAIYAAVADRLQTDIDIISMVKLSRFALTLQPEKVYPLVLSPPADLQPGWRAGMSVFVADWPAVTNHVQRIFEQSPMTAATIAGRHDGQRTC